jgi:methylenetetrahydrofolate dehydrogenase (NADP+)/methenyltetrahydrofolate cyclohydrolase
MAQLLKGKPVVEAISENVCERVAALAERGITPGLTIVRVGTEPDALSYERMAKKRAEALGINLRVVGLAQDVTQTRLIEVIEGINADPAVHGCLLFRPLPRHINDRAVCDALAPEKDIDGISSASLAGVFTVTDRGYPPSTAAACLALLDFYHIPVEGKRVVVLGRSLVIGRPVATMLLARDATVTIVHSRSRKSEELTRDAQVVVCATGRAQAYGPEFFTEGQVVLDVGINFTPDGTMCGDVDFDAVEPVLGEEGAITPVPGGIGGVTAAITMLHVVLAAEKSIRE